MDLDMKVYHSSTSEDVDLVAEGYHNSTSEDKGTGSYVKSNDYRIIVCPFDMFQVKVKVTPANEFLGIVEVGIDKDFLSYKQKITAFGGHDVEEFYDE